MFLIQNLVNCGFKSGQANLFDKMQPVQPPLQTKHPEDVLPKMLVCGAPDSFMPKIVLCQERKCTPRRPKSSSREPDDTLVSFFTLFEDFLILLLFLA